MTEWTSIRVRKDAKAAAESRMPADMTWSQFIADEEYDPEIDYEELAARVADELEARD